MLYTLYEIHFRYFIYQDEPNKITAGHLFIGIQQGFKYTCLERIIKNVCNINEENKKCYQAYASKEFTDGKLFITQKNEVGENDFIGQIENLIYNIF